MSRKTGLLEDVFELAAGLRWEIGVGLAVLSFIVMHVLAGLYGPGAPHRGLVSLATSGSGQSPGLVVHATPMVEMLIGVLGYLLQIVVPPVFLAGAGVSFFRSYFRRSQNSKLHGAIAAAPDGARFLSMDWKEFERVVGEIFRRQGYVVTETGRSGPDGGVDLRLTRDGERSIVQCKYWRARRVPVEVVRELYGVMAAEGVDGAIVVTAGNYTEAARDFATGRDIKLIDGKMLSRMARDIAPRATGERPARPGPSLPKPAVKAPLCPRCGDGMVRRTVRRGQNAGRSVWGCASFPQCRGILPAE